MQGLAHTPRTRLVDAGGCRVHVVEWGDPGRSGLLFLHGGMAHARWWDLVAARLADRLHVVAVDMPGHGDSPWLPPGRYGRHEVAVVEGLLATLGAGRWTLGGHSNGGLQAAVVAARCGAALAGVVLIDIPFDPMAPALMRSGMGFRRMPQPRWETRDEAIAAFRLFPRDGQASPDVLRYLGSHSIREDGDGGWTSKFDWGFFRGRDPEAPNPYESFPDRLRTIACPALVVRGERSAIQSADDHAALLAHIPRATGVVVAGSGHNPHVERPAETAAAIGEFVAELSRGRP